MRRPFDSDATWDGEQDGPAPRAPAPDRYTLGAALGSGGLADVFEAWDHTLQRVVAIKRLRQPDSTSNARFAREAEVAAALDHPGVAPVYDLGLDPEGRPFLAMKRVAGRALTALVREGADLETRLEVFRKICDTVAFAHARGVLHRDLKADNIMVGAFGEVLVMDWGLALRVDETRSAAGVVAGTPSCMAPEQARGEALDPRADVYGLGAVLFTLLTGEALRSGSVEAVLEQARRGEVRSPRALRPELPRELEAIALKALAADPAQRYPSAQALREDIDAVRLRRPLVHLSSSWAERARKWAWRHRGPVRVAAAALLLGALAGLGGLARYSADVGRARDQALAEAERSRLAEREARRGQALASVALADASLAQGRPSDAAAHLDAAEALLGAEAAADPVLALARAQLAAESPPPLARCKPHGRHRVVALDLTADGLGAWSWGADGRLVRWDTATCAVQGEVQLEGQPGVAALDAEGGRAVLGLGEQTVQVDREGRVLAQAPVRPVRVGFDGDLAWAATDDHRLYTLSGPVAELSVPPEAGQTWPAQGGALRVADSTPRGVEQGGVWDADGRVRVVLYGLNSAALEPDGGHLLTLGADRLERIALATGERVWSRPVRPGLRMGLSTEGDRLWALGFDGTVTVHRVEDGAPLVEVTGAPEHAQAALSRGGRVLAVSGDAGEVRVYLTPARPQRRPLAEPLTLCQGLDLSPDGRLLAAACAEGVRLYDARTGAPLRAWDGFPSGVRELRFSPDGARLAVAAREQGVALLHLDGTQEWLGLPARTVSVAWLPDGALVTVDVTGVLHRREPGGGAMRAVGPVMEGATWSVTAAGDHTVLVAGHIQSTRGLRRVDTRTGQRVQEYPTGAILYHHAVSPDGARVAVGSEDGEVLVYTHDGQLERRLQADGGPTMGVAFSPDGRWLASTGYSEAVRVWDVLTGTALRTVRQHQGPGLNLCFSPDGAVLWSGGADGLAALPLAAHTRHSQAAAGLRGDDTARQQALLTLGWWERVLDPAARSPASAELRALARLAQGLALEPELLAALPAPWAEALGPASAQPPGDAGHP